MANLISHFASNQDQKSDARSYNTGPHPVRDYGHGLSPSRKLSYEIKNAQTVDKVEEIWERSYKTFNPVHFNGTISRLATIAKLDEEQRPKCQELAERIAKKLISSGLIHDYRMHNVAIFASAAASLQIKSNDLFQALAEQLVFNEEKLKSLVRIDISMIMNAFLLKGDIFEKLFALIHDVLLKNQELLASFTGHDLARMVNAFSQHSFSVANLFGQINDLFLNDVRLLTSCSGQDRTMIANGFSKRNIPVAQFLGRYRESQDEKECLVSNCQQPAVAMVQHKVDNSGRGLSVARKLVNALKDARTVNKVQKIWQSEGKSFNLFHFNTAISCLSRIAKYPPYPKRPCQELATNLVKELLRSGQIQDYKVKGVAILISSCVSLQVESNDLLQALAKHLLTQLAQLGELTPRAICTIANVFSKQGIPAQEFFVQIKELLLKDDKLLAQCNGQDLAMIMSVLARQKVPVEALFRKINGMLVEKGEPWLANCNGQDLAMIMNVFSKYDIAAVQLFTQINAQLLKKEKGWLANCYVQDIALIANAFSKLNIPAVEFFVQVRELFLKDPTLLAHSNGLDLVMIANGFSKQKNSAEGVFRQINGLLLKDGARLLASCDGLELALLVNCFSKLENPPVDLFCQISILLLKDGARLLASCDGPAITMLVNGFSKLENPPVDLFRQISILLLKDGARLLASLNCQDLALLANGFSKLDGSFKELYGQINDFLLAHDALLLARMNGPELAMIINAFSKQEVPIAELFRQINVRLLENGALLLAGLNGPELAMVVDGFAKQSIPVAKIFGQINDMLSLASLSGELFTQKAETFSKQDVLVTELFARISARLLENGAILLAGMGGKELVMVANGLSKLDLSFKDVFAQINIILLKDGARLLASLSPQGLALIAVAFSKQGVSFKELFALISSELLKAGGQKLVGSTVLGLALIVNGFSKQDDVPVDVLFLRINDLLLAQGALLLKRADCRELALIAEGFSKRLIAAHELFYQIYAALVKENSEGVRLRDSCNSQDSSMIIHAFSKKGIPAQELFLQTNRCLLKDGERLVEKLLKDNGCLLLQCNGQQLALIANALIIGSLCPQTPQLKKLVLLILRQITERDLQNLSLFEKFSRQDLVRLLWCFTVTNPDDAKIPFAQFAEKTLTLLEKKPNPPLSFEEAAWLFQVKLAIQYTKSDIWSKDHAERLSHFLDTKKAWFAMQPTFAPSKMREEIFKLLSSLYSSCQKEFYIEGIGVDLYLPKDRIVINVNGPGQYIEAANGEKDVLDFPSSYKSKLLLAMGYHVEEISYFEWDSVPQDDKALTLNRAIQAFKESEKRAAKDDEKVAICSVASSSSK